MMYVHAPATAWASQVPTSAFYEGSRDKNSGLPGKCRYLLSHLLVFLECEVLGWGRGDRRLRGLRDPSVRIPPSTRVWKVYWPEPENWCVAPVAFACKVPPPPWRLRQEDLLNSSVPNQPGPYSKIFETDQEV